MGREPEPATTWSPPSPLPPSLSTKSAWSPWPTDYTASQAFAHQRRWPIRAKSWDGLIYDSVRRAGGENIALFRPAAVPLPVLQARHFQYDWDKAGAVTVTRLDRIG